MMASCKGLLCWWAVLLCKLVTVFAAHTSEFSVDPLLLTKPPTLELTYVDKTWEKVPEKRNSDFGNNNTWYSEKGSDFFLTCKAPYPIQWTITGFISPPEIVKIVPPARNLSENTFSIVLNIFFLDAEQFPELAASAKISCEQVGDPHVHDAVSIYVPGNSKETLLVPKASITNSTKVTVIPCPTTDPRTAPTLYLRENPGEILVQNVIYVPLEGFRYKSGNVFPGGMYVCRRGTESVTVDVPLFGDYYYAPVSDEIRVFAGESIDLECSSNNNKKVHFLKEETNGTTVETISDLEFSQRIRIRQSHQLLDNPVHHGRSVCLDENNNPVKTWTWYFVQPPNFYLDNLEGEANCLGSVSPKIVQTVRCQNAMECKFMEAQCLSDKTLCNFKKQKQFFADFDTYCRAGKKRGEPCVSVPFSHLNGVAKCGVIGLERHWQYFVSLDYKRYLNWEDVPENELVKIETVSDEDHFDSIPTQFSCSAAAFLFADSLAFRINFRNGSSKLLQTPKLEDNRQIYEFRFTATLEAKMIDSNAISIDCIAPFWNTTDVLISTRWMNQNGKKMDRLIAMPLESTPYTETSTENFYIGEKDKRLNCTVNDVLETDESVVWLYAHNTGEREMEIQAAHPDLMPANSSDSFTYLEFPIVQKKHIGTYHCVRQRNDSTEGTDNERTILKTYVLDVTAEPLEISTTLYVGTTILAMLVVGLVVAGFLVFIQKRSSI